MLTNQRTLGAIIRYKPEIIFNVDRTYSDGRKAPNGIEIRFGNTRPTEQVRNILKKHGFRFSEKQKLWYAQDNSLSRKLIEEIQDSELEADDTQYEKKHFWAKIKSNSEYQKLSPFTEFFVKTEPPKNFYSKKALERGFPNLDIRALMGGELLFFKKFYNVAVDENSQQESEEEIPDPQPQKKSNPELAKRLRRLGDSLEKQIESKLNPAISKQRPTARRMRIASSMREDGLRMQETQSLLYSLADANDSGEISKYDFLKKITSKANAEMLLLYQKAVNNNRDILNTFRYNKTELSKIGIESVDDWHKASEQMNELSGDRIPKNSQREIESKIRELEMKVISSKIPGFFPTPKRLIDQMIKLADLDINDEILEPSSGKGDILDAIKEYFKGDSSKLYACEINSTLREILTLKGYSLIGYDFLDLERRKFDKIMMNPPFEKAQDVEHVLHAWSLLKPEGKLVAIMSEGVFFRSSKKESEFRDFLNENSAYISEPIKDAFKDGFKQTGVAVRIISIEKPMNKKQESSIRDKRRLELEAQAQIELLKLRRSKNQSLQGLDKNKLSRLRQKAWDFQKDLKALDYH